MRPETNTLSELFRAEVRYMVPLYQRPYVWRKDTHWRPLWEDVLDVVERQAPPPAGPASHFLGAVVLDHQQTTPGEVAQRLVIAASNGSPRCSSCCPRPPPRPMRPARRARPGSCGS